MPASTKGKGKTGKGKGKSQRSKPVSQSSRAGLQFPVGRIKRRLKAKTFGGLRVGSTASVFAASVLEYLCAEVLETAGNCTRDFNKKRITPRHILLAIRNDEELSQFIKATIHEGGVVPHIHSVLLNKTKKKKAKKN